MQGLASLSDDALLHELHAIVGSHRRVTAELILQLGEVDARRLHVEEGFPSLFSYCVERLQFSEDEACRRIEAARLVRRFPAIYPLLETATVSLTVIGLLKPHLNHDNHRELLAGVSGASVRRAREWLAARFPQPDVPWSIRKRPESRGIEVFPASVRAETDVSAVSARAETGVSAVSARAETVESTSQARAGAAPPALVPRFAPASSGSARIEPLSRDRFLVKFTASRSMKEKLEQARDLMRHANPVGDLAVVLERAVDLLVLDLERRKQGRTERPRQKSRPAKEGHVTRAARREVVARDGWRCAFVTESGRRCSGQGFLEFDHRIPNGRGGGSEPRNLRVLCRAHNRLAAERVYGKAHVLLAITDSRGRTCARITSEGRASVPLDSTACLQLAPTALR